MSIRRSMKMCWKSRNRKARTRRLRSTSNRDLRLEPLEHRRLLATGPTLAGIQPNGGALLKDGQVMNVAPVDLTFLFSEAIDPSTLDGVRITRSGLDGQFEKAHATTDFNTGGAVVMDFTAASAGATGNGIQLTFIKNALGAGVGPQISVQGDTILVELNTTVGSQTRAGQLRDALNQNVQVHKLLTASIRAGGNVSTIIATPQITYSPVILHGANTASVCSNFNAGAGLEIEFTSTLTGQAGLGTQIVVTKADLGGVSPPTVTVNGKTINVVLNSNASGPTTAEQLVAAINAHPQAGALVTAAITVGRPDTVIGNRAITYSPLTLKGASDIVVQPGYVGLGDTPQQVVVRFAESLPDDLYYVEVLGTGATPLRGLAGGAFGDRTDDGVDNGADYQLRFELDLGAQVLAVVPQPLRREWDGVLKQWVLRQSPDKIQVYFNNDDLYPTKVTTSHTTTNPAVVDPRFYQLIFTNDTVHNTDDVVYYPTTIAYDPASDMAELSFAGPLDTLGSGYGTYRLRVGIDEALPPTPAWQLAEAASAVSDFNTGGAVQVRFQAQQDFATAVTIAVAKRDWGGPGGPAVSVTGQAIVVELNTSPGNETTAQMLVDAMNSHSLAGQLVAASVVSAPGSEATDIATPATAGAVLTLAGLGSSFDTASDLGVLGSQGRILASTIDTQAYTLEFPGAIDEPGHRDISEVQQHYLSAQGDAQEGISLALYNFRDAYGTDPQGNVLHNAITEAQKQRAREIFTLYSEYLGIQFIETQDLGMTIATGDLRAVDPAVATGPGGVLGIAGGGLTGLAVMDAQDFTSGDDLFGGAWFQTAMHEIGHLLGLGHTTELPPLTIMGDDLSLAFSENTVEPVFPGINDIIHGQYLYIPESKDIDLYRFQLTESGRFSAEAFAERLPQGSLLNTVISLYRVDRGGGTELIARNDEYYSNDSYLELDLSAGTYCVAVSASGNDQFDPAIEDTGLGGRSEGEYELRLNFRPTADRTIVDATGVRLDGDADGVPGGAFNVWFRVAPTIFVDKSAPAGGSGTLDKPFQTISRALAAATPGSVVRVVGNGGADGNLATVADNLAYEIGFNRLGAPMADGAALEVPRGVTLMVDAGAVLKLRRAAIGVGSSTTTVDRSGSALQVLGTPVLLDASGNVIHDAEGNVIPGSVYLTSLHDAELGTGANPDKTPPGPAAGDWGGIIFRNDVDSRDRSRLDYEKMGVFLNYVNQADFRYGGGTVVIDGVAQTVTPVQMNDARPTVSYNTITQSADAAISASPNSFAETNFHAPQYQFVPFTSDYDRVGPEIHGNRVTGNSINGLFVRITTPAGTSKQPLTVSGRWDDNDIPHVLADRLVIRGTPGGAVYDPTQPLVQPVGLTAVAGGELATGTYNYRLTFVDSDGNEGAYSDATASIAIDGASAIRSIQLDNLPLPSGGFVARRLYRSDTTGNPAGTYTLVAELNATSRSFVDNGSSLGRVLITTGVPGLRSRLDARLAIDPGVVMKLVGGGIETTFGADLYAEGLDGREVIFTSIYDNRYGGGGTFVTAPQSGQASAAPGDWGGLFVGHATRLGLDHAVVAFGGGEMNVEGTFASFNALEIHQSAARVAHTLFQQNARGTGSNANSDRLGRGFNRAATIFVRGAQPVIVDNVFLDNSGSVISIDVNSLNSEDLADYGRSTYGKGNLVSPLDAVRAGAGNQGPLVRLNRLDGNAFNALQVRGGTLIGGGVWDDTDIVHLLRDETVYVPDFHTYGGLRLESAPTESLVVKFEGSNAGITATGKPLDIKDRIGGAVYVIGQPGFPVVLTSAYDNSVGAGVAPSGASQTVTVETMLDPSVVGGSTLFNFNFGPTALADPRVVQGVQLAGQLWSAVLGDAVTISIDVEVGSTSGPSALAEASTLPVFFPYDMVRSLMIRDAGTHESSLMSMIPSFANLATIVPNSSYTVDSLVQLTPANAKALGIGSQWLPQTPSQYNPQATIDSAITISSALLNTFDFDRTDGIAAGLIDFVGTMMHEIGHVLGFISSVDSVDAGQTNIQMTPMDMFRVQPASTRPADFSAAPRVLDPRVPVQVLYDGGQFDPTGLPIAGLGKGDLPMSRGQTNGDGYQASHFKDDSQLGGFLMGLLDPVASLGSTMNLTINDKHVFDMIGWDLAYTAVPGDWRGVVLDTYSHDRNVGMVVEDEAADVAAPGNNATAEQAQFLGGLATGEKAGDENLRLGFEIHGTLSAPNDADVYSFTAAAGTEVWFDIDDTGTRLDTLVELIEANDQVLARSDNSLAEAADPSLLYRSPAMPAGSVNPLSKAGYDPSNPSQTSELQVKDYYTTNPRDAGMRVVLPGQPGTTATYHVRVSSQGGKTSGNYQLQVRLRELDEVPGSTVRYADIRYATHGIQVLGQPAHSPLLGEAAETEIYGLPASNDSLATAQELGNPLQTDRGALSVAGYLDNPNDVDFYRLTIDYESIQTYEPLPYLSTIFDVDYTDGLGRPNTELWIFDSNGRLILKGNSSNIADDRSGSSADLGAGSAGGLDPFIGPVELPAGSAVSPVSRGVYYVAVSSNAQMPDELSQFLVENPTNPYVRLEPIDSLRRIAEDRVGFSGDSGIPESPTMPVLFHPTESIVPFDLSDVTLFVTTDYGLASGTSSTLYTVDAYTGKQETTAGSFPVPIGDIAMRGDGNIFGYSVGPDNYRGNFNDSTIGRYVQIDSATGASNVLTDDGVDTNVRDPANPANPERAPVGQNNDGVGVYHYAMAYRTTTNSQYEGYVIGTRGDSYDNSPEDLAYAGIGYLENILYHFDINTGTVANRSPGASDKTGAALLTGAGTNRIEFGEVLTYTRITPRAPEIGDVFTITINGQSISYTSLLGTVQEVVAGLASAWNTAAQTIAEFACFEVVNRSFPFANELRVRLSDPQGAYFDIQTSTTNGGLIPEQLTVEGFGPGGIVTGMDFVSGQLYAVTDRGGLFQVSLFGSPFGGGLGTYVRSSAADLMTAAGGSPIRFAGLTAGPAVENGRYSDVLFGISDDGVLYALNTAGELQPVFVNEQTSVSTGLFAVTGLAFSTLERNLWTVTTERSLDDGHGFNGPGRTYVPFDLSRDDTLSGGSSFYFGNDRSTNRGGNQSFSNTTFVRDYNFPGGAHGSLMSSPFSLEGYSAEDRPMLYFTYYLDTENTDYNPLSNPPTPTRDTFRVYVSGDDGNWTLVATNDLYQSSIYPDEFDIGYNDTGSTYPAGAVEPSVQKLFDNTGTWRQARISLANFAGQDNVRVRFDFSTAGAMTDVNLAVGELRAVAGSELRDGQTFTLDGTIRLEFDLGYTLVAPNGAAIQDGSSFDVGDATGAITTYEFDSDNRFARDILAVNGRQLRDGDQFTVFGSTAVTFEFDSGYSLQVSSAGARTGGVADGDTLSVSPSGGGAPVVFEFDSDDVFTGQKIDLVTDSGILIPPTGLKDGDTFTINDNAGSGDVAFEFDDNKATTALQVVDLTNIQLQVPIAGGGPGGVADGQRFVINEGLGGPDITFEFDKDGSTLAGTRVISITSQSTQDEVAQAIVAALQSAGIGLNPVYYGGGVIRLGIFKHTVNTANAPSLVKTTVAATLDEIADRLVYAIDNSGLALSPWNAGVGLVQLGSRAATVTIPAGVSLSQTAIYATQSQLANRIMSAIQSVPALGLAPVNLGSGLVHIGQAAAMAVSTQNADALALAGAPGVSSGQAIVFRPSDTAAQVAARIADAINSSAANVTATASGAVVDLPDGVSFSPGTSPLSPAGVVPVPFTFGDSSAAVAGNMDAAIRGATSMALYTVGNRVNLPQAKSVTGSGLPASFVDGRPGTSVSGNTAVRVHAGMSAEQVAESIANALGRATGGYSEQIVATVGSQIADGEYFTISDGTVTIRFEFDALGSPPAGGANTIAIPYAASAATSPASIAALIRSAIETARVTKGLNVSAVAAGNRRVNLVGANVITGFLNAPSLSVVRAGGSVHVYQNIIDVAEHVVTDPGPLGVEDYLAGDEFGAFTTSGPPSINRYPGALRGMDNAHEGVYIDDIVIGFAERGEMVVGANANSAFIPNSELLNPNLPVGYTPHTEIHVGPYQLEVRQAEQYALAYATNVLPAIALLESYDTNERQAEAVSLDVPAGHHIREGQTLVISDGTGSVAFEFDDLEINNGVQAGRVRIGYNTSDSAIVMARRIRDTVNSAAVQSVLKTTASLSDGAVTGTASTSHRINFSSKVSLTFEGGVAATTRQEIAAEPNDVIANAVATGIGTQNVGYFEGLGTIGDNPSLAEPTEDLDLFEVYLTAGQTITIDIDTARIGSALDPVVMLYDANGYYWDTTTGYLLGYIASFNPGPLEFTPRLTGRYYVGVSGYPNFLSDIVNGGSYYSGFGPFSTGNYRLRISSGAAATGFALAEFTGTGDRNLERDQGQIVIEGNSISNSLGYGIVSDAGARDGAGNVPHQGPVRLTREVNTARLATGVTIVNNLITGSGVGGIRFSGETWTMGQQPGPLPFGRILNNTIVGKNGSGVGIQVDENASPTLLNNIVTGLAVGISVDASSSTTVVGGMLFKDNAANTVGVGTGSFPIVLASNEPLFVDPASGNYYLAPASRAIDSSVNSLQDRPQLVAVKSPLGYGLSPILAPALDVFGQKRVDDPSVETPTGQGANVFKDRGAIDRADFAGLSAVLLLPRDNDAQGRDGDARKTYVELKNEVLTSFAIQLADGVNVDGPQDGTGANDRTVASNRVSIYRDGEKLAEGVDYSFHYDATNNVIRLTPLAGMWEINRVYEIALSNAGGFLLAAPQGTAVNDGDQFTITDLLGTTATFEYDSGYAIRVPQTLAIQIPPSGGAALRDGATFTIGDGTRTQVFEFDNNGATDTGNVAIPFTAADSDNDVANAIVAALSTAGLGLSPANIVNYGGRAVHLGCTSVHTLDTSLSGLTQTGVAAGIESGQTFTIDNGVKVVTFEFTETGGGSAAVQPVRFSRSQTHEQIADAMAAAINAAFAGDAGLAAAHPANSDGLVLLGPTTRHILDASASRLAVTGQPGVRPAWGLKIPTIAGVPDYATLLDGQTFRISNGPATQVTFELDSDGITTPGNRVVSFTLLTTAAQLAAAIAVAIRNAGLGLNPSSSAEGIVTLGGTVNHSLDVTNTVLQQIGQPGVPAARRIYFQPGATYAIGAPVRQPLFDEKQMALAIKTAIDQAVQDGVLSGVTADVPTQNGQATVGEVLVGGAASVSGANVTFGGSIADMAGNALAPNREDGTTQFTVFVGSGIDYGDAPSPYPTLDAENGARHRTVEGFYLGPLGSDIDMDIDGQPNSTATGDDDDGFDDEDGVLMAATLWPQVKNGPVTITVLASAAGFLDAWFDFNRDGDWNDAGEKVFDSQPLVAGANVQAFTLPTTFVAGETYARFRFSSLGGLAPTGLAEDGEVEDYRVAIRSPRQNASNSYDVNASGNVTALDALLVINKLNRTPAGTWLDPPAPGESPVYYWDVNGNGTIEPRDALAIINYLNRGGSGEGEASAILPLAADPGEQGEGEAMQGLAGAATTLSATQNASYVGLESGPAGLAAALAATAVVDHRISGYGSGGPEQSPVVALPLAVAEPLATQPQSPDPAEILRQSHEEEWDDLAEALSLAMAGPKTVHERIFRE